MPRLEIGRYEADPAYRAFIADLIEKVCVCGFCIFGGSVESLPIILEKLQTIAHKAGLPRLLMSCDCEWGLPMRLNKGGTEFPHLMALEKMGDQHGIRQVATAIGIEMSALGLHWNFAPVADINSNPENPIINIRSFSGDPEAVAECAESFFEGLESVGIIATAKHFPGHGDTSVDSHLALPSIDRSVVEFESIELVPFKRLSKAGIPSIMTGHIAAPMLAESLGANKREQFLPATISSYLTKKLLREIILYEGVIITDSLEMYGLQQVVNDPAEIAIRAIQAGADILLMPTDPFAAFNGLSEAIREGEIDIVNLEESYQRVEKLTKKYVKSDSPKITVKWLEHEKMAQMAATNAFSIVGEIPKPLRPSSVIIIASGSERERIQRDALVDFFSKEFSTTRLFVIKEKLSDSSLDCGDKPLILTFFRPRGALTEESVLNSVHSTVAELTKILKERQITPIGVICLGDPYISERFSIFKSHFILNTYSDSMASLNSLFRLLIAHN